MPKVQLASQRLQTGQSSRGISPTMLSGSVGQIANSAINSNAGNVAFTQVPRHEVVLDTTLDSAAQAASVFEQASFRYNERVADAKARVAYSELETQIDTELNTYGSQLGQAGVDGYKGFAEKVQAIQTTALEAQDPFVRSKFAIQAKSLTSNAVQKGAQHNATQLRVWQGEIEKNQEQKAQVKLFDASPNEGEYDAIVAERLQGIASQYAGQQDVIELKQAEFKNTAFANTIESHTRLGNFAMAGAYLDKASKAKSDPMMLTKLADHLQNQMESVNNSKMTAIFNEQRLTEIKEKQQFVTTYNYLEKNIHNMTPEQIDAYPAAINDPGMRQQMQKGITDMLAGRPSNARDTRVLMLDRPENILNPELIFSVKYNGMNEHEKNVEYGKLIALKQANAGPLLKATHDWVSQVIPKSSMSGIIGAEYEKKADPMRTVLHNDYMATMEDAMRKNEDLNLATEAWKSRTAKSAWLQDAKIFSIPKESLAPVIDAANNRIDLSSLKLEGLTPQAVDKTFQQSVQKLQKVRNFPDVTGKSMAEIQKIKTIYSQTPDFKKYQIDFYKLELQREYYKQQANKASTKSNDGSLNPNAGK